MNNKFRSFEELEKECRDLEDEFLEKSFEIYVGPLLISGYFEWVFDYTCLSVDVCTVEYTGEFKEMVNKVFRNAYCFDEHYVIELVNESKEYKIENQRVIDFRQEVAEFDKRNSVSFSKLYEN